MFTIFQFEMRLMNDDRSSAEKPNFNVSNLGNEHVACTVKVPMKRPSSNWIGRNFFRSQEVRNERRRKEHDNSAVYTIGSYTRERLRERNCGQFFYIYILWYSPFIFVLGVFFFSVSPNGWRFSLATRTNTHAHTHTECSRTNYDQNFNWFQVFISRFLFPLFGDSVWLQSPNRIVRWIRWNARMNHQILRKEKEDENRMKTPNTQFEYL